MVYADSMLKNILKGKPTDHCPICSSLEEKITSQILSVIKMKTFGRGHLICEQGSNVCGLFLINKGSVKVSRLSPHGKEVILDILHPGATFGEAGLLGAESLSNHITANEDSEVFFISHEDFQSILSENPELYKKVFNSLVRWMDKLNAIIENINNPSAKERVCQFIKRLGEEQNHSLIHLNGKKHEVAMMLGLRPETFSRALADLEKAEIIKMNHKQIQILKPNAL